MEFLKSLFSNKAQKEAEIERILSRTCGVVFVLLAGCERLDAIEENYWSVAVEYTHVIDNDYIDFGDLRGNNAFHTTEHEAICHISDMKKAKPGYNIGIQSINCDKYAPSTGVLGLDECNCKVTYVISKRHKWN